MILRWASGVGGEVTSFERGGSLSSCCGDHCVFICDTVGIMQFIRIPDSISPIIIVIK